MDDIAASMEAGSLGVRHLKRIWSSAMAERRGQVCSRNGEEYLDLAVFSALGLGLTQTLEYLYMSAPTFDNFEEWVTTTAGTPDTLSIDRINAEIAGQAQRGPVHDWLEWVERSPAVLTPDDLSCWAENGYVVLKNAVTEEAAAKAERAICEYVGADRNSPDSWYQRKSNGIMVELIQHPNLEMNRRSARIHKAFAQLWKTADLWVSVDRCSFHPPQRNDYTFQGPDLHWDIDFDRPLTFGTQGILYLTDTLPEQGALTLVPGFHRRLSAWLKTLDSETDPNEEDLHALGSVAVGGNAGDMVVWHHALPHGSRPNTGTRPRFVQYINMLPTRVQKAA